MSFLNLLFLAGMAGIAGPILAHLLARPRYRRIPFTMMQFLEAGQMESNQRRRIRNLFMLLLRCAIIACIVFGFAGPVLEETAEATVDGPRILIGLDDSLSMRYKTRFNDTVAKVQAELDLLPADAQVSVLGLASGARMSNVPPPEAAGFLDTMTPVAAHAQLAPLLGLLHAEEDSGMDVLIASDFTSRFVNEFAINGPAIRVAHATFVSPDDVQSTDNSTIQDVRATAALDGGIRLTVRVHNQDSQSRTVSLQALSGEITSGTESADVPPGRVRGIDLSLRGLPTTNESLPVTVSILTEDGLSEDNHYYLGLRSPKTMGKHVLILCRDRREAFLVETALNVLGEKLPQSQLTTQTMPAGRLNRSALQAAGAVVITSVTSEMGRIAADLGEYLRGGGQLITFLHRLQDQSTLEAFYAEGLLPAIPRELQERPASVSTVNVIDAGHRNDDAIRALENYQFGHYLFDAWYGCEVADTARTQWPLESGSALLYRTEVGMGDSILINTSADDSLSGLSKSPAILPLYSYLLGGGGRVEVAAFDASTGGALPYVASGSQEIPQSMAVSLVAPGGALVGTRLEDELLLIPSVQDVGIGAMRLEPPLYVGLNVPDGETDLTPPAPEAVSRLKATLFQETGATTASAKNSSKTTRTHFSAWALSAALLLLLLETLVANRWVR